MTTLTELHEQDLLERMQEEVTKKTPPPPAPRAGANFFADVLLEVDSTERRRRKWSAVSSLTLQCLMLATVLIIPLMFTEALPKAQLLTFLVAPPPPPPPPPPAAPAARIIRSVESDMTNGRLRTPTRIPEKVQMIREEEAPPQLNGGGVIGGVEGGIPGGQLGGVIGGIVNSTSSLALPKLAAPVMPKRVRVSSGVVTGMLINKVEPPYPVIARSARVQGEVVLTAVISKEGTIQNLQVVSGHPLLIKAAMEAVQQWRYRPYFVSGEPVEVETNVIVTFRLGQ